MTDARDTFHAVNSKAILCLWDIQLTFDRNGVGTYGAIIINLSALQSRTICFLIRQHLTFAEVSAILEPANST